MMVSNVVSRMMETHVEVVQERAQYLVVLKDNVCFSLLNIYAPNTIAARKLFWEELLDKLPLLDH